MLNILDEFHPMVSLIGIYLILNRCDGVVFENETKIKSLNYAEFKMLFHGL